MTTIITRIDISAAIAAGSNAQGAKRIEIDVSALTQQQRVALADQMADPIAAGRMGINSYEPMPVVCGCTDHTEAAAIAALDVRVAAAAIAAQRNAEEQTLRDAAVLAAIEIAKTCPIDDLLDFTELRPLRRLPGTVGPYGPMANNSAASLAGRADEANAEIARRRAEAEQRKSEAAAAKAKAEVRAAAEREAGIAQLRQWAAKNGSEALSLMLETGAGDWKSAATDEYVSAHCPNIGGLKFSSDAWYASGDTAPRRKPEAAELRALKVLRELCASPGSVLENPELLWCRVAQETDDDGEITQEAESYPALSVDVRLPVGRLETVALHCDRLV